MDYSDFIRLLGADPHSQDPGFLRARNSGEEFTKAAQAADKLEAALQQALSLAVPETLEADVLQYVYAQPKHARVTWPMALAASLFMMVSAAGVFVWHQSQGVDVLAYVQNHYQHDGQQLVEQALKPASAEQIEAIMASVSARAGAGLASQVYFIKNCPTPQGKGAHMVIKTDQGLVTVYYMPKTDIESAKNFEMPGFHGSLVALEQGSAAVIGASLDSVRLVTLQLRDGILPDHKLNT